MRKNYLFLSIFLIFSFFACNKTNNSGDIQNDIKPGKDTRVPDIVEKEDPDKYLITDSTAGPFHLGSELPGPATMMKYQMRVEQITRYSEDGPSTESVTIIGENNEDLLWLKPGFLAGSGNHDNRIYEILVLSPRYRTKDNIGVGSTIFDFQKTYHDYHVWYTYVSDMFVAESDSISAQFILDKDDYIGPEIEIESEITPLLISDFKKTGKIKIVRLLRVSNS